MNAATLKLSSLLGALAIAAVAAGPAEAQSAAPVYNPAPGLSYFPMNAGYSWTFRDAQGNRHDIRCVNYDRQTATSLFTNLSGKNEVTEVARTTDRFGQPIVNAHEIGRGTPAAPMALWGKLFASRYPWIWNGTADPALKGVRRSSSYRSAIEPAGMFLRPLVYDIAPAPGVADAGIEQIVLERGVGMLEQTFNTIRGPVAWELESAKTDAGQLPAALHGVVTTLTLDPPGYTYPGIIRVDPNGNPIYTTPKITATFEAHVRAGSGRVIPLTFRSGQRAELELYGPDDQVVRKWSTGRAFTRNLGFTELKDGQPFRFVFTDVPMPGPLMDYNQRYRFRAFITDEQATPGGNVRFGAQELFAVFAGM